MIYTLTTNPAVDLNICSDGMVSNLVNRVHGSVYTPNGKGLNVSFVLGHFGIPSVIAGFFGGFTGDYIEKETRNRGYDMLPVHVEEITRINIFLNDGKDEYKFVNRGSYVSQTKQKEMLDQLEKASDMECLVISGSLPPGIQDSYYEQIFEVCQKHQSKVVLDISSRKLKELLCFRPYLIKPNDEEIFEIFGWKLESDEDFKEALQKLHHLGAQNILLTMGSKGAWFYNGTDFYRSTARPIQLLSSACAGDSALAAFLSIWMNHPDRVEDAMIRSAATGACVAESNGIGDLKNVEKYSKDIVVRKGI
ncbi:MAG: 1-phosphofructokinase family hexose kinase [Erysipelotrichaceae bacterium]|nr:1-phosphofructokinase family hexose kinase [Erysipelotrichaceae bacterium]